MFWGDPCVGTAVYLWFQLLTFTESEGAELRWPSATAPHAFRHVPRLLIYLNKSSFPACVSGRVIPGAERDGTERRGGGGAAGGALRRTDRRGAGAMAGPLLQAWGLGAALRSRAALRPLGLLAPPCRELAAPGPGSGEAALEENPFYGKYRHKIQELRRCGRAGPCGAGRGQQGGRELLFEKRGGSAVLGEEGGNF